MSVPMPAVGRSQQQQHTPAANQHRVPCTDDMVRPPPGDLVGLPTKLADQVSSFFSFLLEFFLVSTAAYVQTAALLTGYPSFQKKRGASVRFS